MSPDYADYGQNIAEQFQEYLKTGDDRLIEKYSIRELQTAVSKLSPFYDNNKQWYRLIERRIEELSILEELKKERKYQWLIALKEKWLDKVVSFLFGLIIGILLNRF